MTSELVYFPYIRLPNNTWLYRSLLYWDKIGTIVPFGQVGYLEEKYSNSFLLQLFQAELAEPIDPEETIRNKRSFVDSFVDYIDDEAYPVKQGALSRGAETTPIHSDKLFGLVGELTNRDLAMWTQGGPPWLHVEKYTADRFMAYIAGVIGHYRNMMPTTDQRRFLPMFTSPGSIGHTGVSRRDIQWVTAIENMLPTPIGRPKLQQLVDFKQRHGDRLGNLRKRIEEFLVELEDVEPGQAREERVQRFRSELDGEVKEIVALIEESDMSRVGFGTLLTLSAASLAIASPLFPANALLFGAIGAAIGIANVYASFRDKRNTEDRFQTLEAEIKQLKSVRAEAIEY